jgi:hypothetical protein
MTQTVEELVQVCLSPVQVAHSKFELLIAPSSCVAHPIAKIRNELSISPLSSKMLKRSLQWIVT